MMKTKKKKTSKYFVFIGFALVFFSVLIYSYLFVRKNEHKVTSMYALQYSSSQNEGKKKDKKKIYIHVYIYMHPQISFL